MTYLSIFLTVVMVILAGLLTFLQYYGMTDDEIRYTNLRYYGYDQEADALLAAMRLRKEEQKC